MATNRTTFNRFQRGWRILIIFVSAFAVAALIWSILITPMYRASAKFLVYPNDTLTSSRDVVSSLDTLDKRTISTTYADIMDSNRVYQDTINRLQLSEATVKDVKVYSEVETNTNILVLHVEGPDPKVATLLVNNIGQNGISYIKSIYQVYSIAFLDLAVEPQTPYIPQPLIDTLIAAGAGLLAGFIFLILRETLRVPLETLRERAVTDKQSLAFTRKYLIRSMVQELVKKKKEPLAFGIIYLQGLEDLIEDLPERITGIVMQNVVERFHDLLRGNDLVGRWNKLEFGVMLPSTPEFPAKKTFERLLQALEEPLQTESGDSISLTPVAGVVTSSEGDTSDLMTARAEKALKEARTGAYTLVVVK
jgi:capsular polysaccharide biosynthesis protein